MVRPVDGVSPPPQQPQVDATQAPQTTKETQTTQQTQTTQEPGQSAPQPAPRDSSSQLAEHSLAGTTQAAHLQSQVKDSAPAGTAEKTMLKQGDKGPQVETAQKEINQWRAGNGKEVIKEDGNFGPKTEAAVKDFQKTSGLKSDGIIGPSTQDRLKLENDANFKNVNPDTQKQIRDQMNSYQKDETSRKNLMDLGTDPNFSKLSKEGQDAALKKLQGNPQDAGNLQNIKENGKRSFDC